jgi:deoxycytidylate deaminase
MDVAKAKEGSSSHHPTKTVATIILSPNNRMLAMAANGIPAGLSIHGDCFLNSLRKYSTSCSEPNAMAEILGIKAEIPKKYKGSKSHFDLVRAAVQKRRRALYKKDQPNRNLLEGSTFIVTALSCTLCAPLLVEYKIGTLIYDVTGGIHFTRKDKNDEALAILRCGGVTVRGFNSTTCSFVPT